jgi:transglutaminase-like putative cysteine protease
MLRRSASIAIWGFFTLLSPTACSASSPDTAVTRTVSVTLGWTITAKRGTELVILTTLLPQTIPGRQRVLAVKYSRRPEKVFEKNDNKYAVFVIEDVSKPVEIAITIDAEIYRYNIMIASKNDTASRTQDASLRPWLVDERYLELNAAEIQEAAKGIDGKDELDTVKKIMAFVQRTVKTSGYDPEDRGALRTLREKKGDCGDFTDLVVALCRAKGIPARVCTGYVTYPVSKDYVNRHAWVEAYTKQLGWIPFDPFHVALGGDRFEEMKNYYLYMSRRLNDPILENGFYYRCRYYGNEVECKDTFRVGKEVNRVKARFVAQNQSRFDSLVRRLMYSAVLRVIGLK